MKKIFTLLATLMLCIPAFARTFTYYHEGNALIYEVTNEGDKTCSVAENKYVYGDLVIPAIASDGQNDYTVTAIGKKAFYQTSITSVDIPYTVIEIGEYAFYDCEGLVDLVVPGNVENIRSNAFESCINLKTVFLSDGVKNIKAYGFNVCYSLESIRFSNTLKEIGTHSFSHAQFKSIEIPNSVTNIKKDAFSYCESLTKVIIGNGVTSLGECAFQYCFALTDITLGNSLTTIGENAFYNCYNITTVTLPSSVTSIGDHAFQYCDNLTKITLSESLNELGSEIFRYCSKLAVIENPSPTPMPFSGLYPFTDENYQNATLYVPSGSLAAYRSTLPWSPFRSIKEKDFSGIDEVEADTAEIDLNAPYEIYNLMGERLSGDISTVAHGIYILRQGNAVKKYTIR